MGFYRHWIEHCSCHALDYYRRVDELAYLHDYENAFSCHPCVQNYICKHDTGNYFPELAMKFVDAADDDGGGDGGGDDGDVDGVFHVACCDGCGMNSCAYAYDD